MMAIHELVRHCGERHADRVAIEEPGKALLYRELCQRVEEMRLRLEPRVASGNVVAVVGHRSIETIVAALAVWSHGCLLMNVDDSLPQERQQLMFATVAPALTIRCSVTTEFDLAGTSQSKFLSSDNDHAYIAFTSGSTGRPKAILGSHRGLSHFVQWQIEEFGINPADRFAHLTNISFDVWLRDAFTPLAAGATLCIPGDRHLSARDLFDFIESQGVTAMHVVPSVANHWINSAPSRPAMSSLRVAFFAGEPLEGVLVRRWTSRFPSCEVVNLYGPTETTLAKHFKRVAPQPHDGVQVVGHPMPGTNTHILDENLCHCTDGVVGEICIETPWRSHGYLHETGIRAPFVEYKPTDGPVRSIYRTGDLGLRRADGEIEVRGRLDDQVKINGVRIELLEIKSVIASYPGIRDVFVCTTGTGYDLSLAAIVEAPPDIAAHLIPALRARLPAAMVPSRVVTLSALPRLPNGKLNRTELTRLAAADVAAAAPLAGPVRSNSATATGKLETLWQEVLRNGPVDPHRNFFESGGTSLSIIALHARIEEVFQIRLPVVRLFEFATLASQAAMLSGDMQPGHATAGRQHTARHALRANTLGARRPGQKPAQQWSERRNQDAQT